MADDARRKTAGQHAVRRARVVRVLVYAGSGRACTPRELERPFSRFGERFSAVTFDVNVEFFAGRSGISAHARPNRGLLYFCEGKFGIYELLYILKLSQVCSEAKSVGRINMCAIEFV